MYTLDTNAIIYYLKGDVRAVPVLRDVFSHPETPVYVSALTEAELFSFPQLSEEEARLIGALLRTVSLIPLDSQIARIAGMLRRTYRLKLPDSVIAATALFTGSTLLTRNTRDFKKIPGLLIEVI
ncbi:MAG: type II toxin-antitoxin system VapC family toxin [Candidatus Binatia bacterium]